MARPTRTVHSIIIGAGPSGLSAAYALARAGLRPLVIEKDTMVGGQVRQVKHGDFVLDVGRKELYTRIPAVEDLWNEVLGDDLRPYEHRVGSLYDGRILELSASHGLARGVPIPSLLTGLGDLIYARATARGRATNLEDYWYRKTGKRFAQMFAQGYWEKLRGMKWKDMPAPESSDRQSASRSECVRQAMNLFVFGRPYHQRRWKHPKYGVGQLCESMARAIRAAGGELLFGSRLAAISHKGGIIDSVRIQSADGGSTTIGTSQIISSIDVELLRNLLGVGSEESSDGQPRLRADVARGVVLVYLFLDGKPRFPHAWLEVNDPRLRAGRITNYTGFNGAMVPPGKTCLCVEFFWEQGRRAADLGDADYRDIALRETASCGLIDPARCVDTLVMRIPRSHAALTWRHWESPAGKRLLDDLRRFPNLFHVNRGGVDRACHAGLEAARAVISGSREAFDVAAHPARVFSDEPVTAAHGAPRPVPDAA
jgi:protoporphyrinogen oxidase